MNNLSILYVEDEKELREQTSYVLKRFCSTLFTAEDGAVGLSLYNTFHPDIVITDINMPHLNGLQLANEIRKSEPNQKIVFLTAFTQNDYMLEALELHADGYIIKPIDFEILEVKINKIAKEISISRELENYKHNLEMLVNEKSQQIKLQQDQLIKQAGFAAMGEMIGMIAHQWKQPLATINLILSKLRVLNSFGDLNSQLLVENIEKIENMTTYQNQTIKDFLNFFKNQHNSENIKVTDLLQKPLRLLTGNIKTKQIDVSLECEVDKNLELSIDSSKLNQVLINIIKNAIDELDCKKIDLPKIQINAKIDNKDDLLITINDNAGGIPQDVLPRIFDAYFTTKDDKGNGIGLYMSKLIIENHFGGTINAENTTNGACFSITLPNKYFRKENE